MTKIEERSWGISKFITDYFILNPPKFGDDEYKSISKFKNQLIFIPSGKSYIPCLFYRQPKSSNFLIHFHGNSEHIFQIEHYGLDFRSHLEMNVILVEYPGYSIYDNEEPDPNTIFKNACIIYDWITNTFKANKDQIFVCGRSLGTSPAIYLAAHKDVKSLFLISAFTSINKIGEDKNIGWLLEDIFKSYNYIQKVNCFTLLIHGKKDPLINYKHSQELKKELEKNNSSIKVEVHFGEENDHNNFYLRNDIIEPINQFLKKYNLKTKDKIIDIKDEEIKEFYKMPISISKKIESRLFKIEDFKFFKKIVVKNASFLMKLIDNRIALVNGSSILIYNQKNYCLDEEIKVNEKTDEIIEIKCLFQMKNENLACGTNSGDIILYKYDDDSEKYEEIKTIANQYEIYKIDEFCEGLICVLSKDGITIYDNIYFNKKYYTPLKILYFDFVHTSGYQLAMLNENYLSILEINQNEVKVIRNSKKIEINNKKNVLISTNKYLVLGVKKNIYILDHSLNIIEKKENHLNGDINYIHKIHDEFLLASTDRGEILQITIEKKNKYSILEIKSKIFTSGKIYSLLLKNITTILFTYDEGIQIFNMQKEDNCNFI